MHFGKILAVFALLLALVSQAWAFRPNTGNLLENAGAEYGDMSGWFHSEATDVVTEQEEQTGIVYPRSGSYFFSMATAPSDKEYMEQVVDLVAYENYPFVYLSGYVQTEYIGGSRKIRDSDHALATLTFRDAIGDTLANIAMSPIGFPVEAGSQYGRFNLAGDVPDDAVDVVVRFDGVLVQGIFVNVFLDDLSLILVR